MAYEMHVFKQIKINSNNFRREVLFYRHHCKINEKNMKKKYTKDIFILFFYLEMELFTVHFTHTHKANSTT